MNILGEMGVKKVRTLGIDGGTQLRRRVLEELPALENGLPSFDAQFRELEDIVARARDRLRPADRADAGLLRLRRVADRRRARARVHDPQAREPPGPLLSRCSNVPTPVPKDPANRGRTGFSFSRFHIPRAGRLQGPRRSTSTPTCRSSPTSPSSGISPSTAHKVHVHPPGRAAGAVEGLELVPPRPPDERDAARLRAARLGHRRDRRRARRGTLLLRGPDVRPLHRRRRARSTTRSRRPGTTSSTTSRARPSSSTTPSCPTQPWKNDENPLRDALGAGVRRGAAPPACLPDGGPARRPGGPHQAVARRPAPREPAARVLDRRARARRAPRASAPWHRFPRLAIAWCRCCAGGERRTARDA